MARYMPERGGQTLFVKGSLGSLLPESSVVRPIWSALSELDFSRFNVVAGATLVRCFISLT